LETAEMGCKGKFNQIELQKNIQNKRERKNIFDLN